MGTEEIRKDMDISSWCGDLIYDQWVPLPVNGKPPSARYKHAAAVVDDKLYVIGGSRNGRYLSDVQVFYFKSLTWSNMSLRFEPNVGDVSKDNPLATSGHVLIKWGNKLLIIGGHSKSSLDSIEVRFINLETHTSGFLETSGDIPAARGGHSATLIGSRLIVFGGEDRKRKLLSDIHILDLETMTWERVDVMQTPPAPRFDHTSAVHGDRYLLVFGGCSHSIFYNDLHVFDLQTKEWSQPEILGDLVAPRAGHAGVTIGENWYIVGGGDNKSGCSDTLVFTMSKLVWSTLSSVKERDPLASEGLSVCTTFIAGETYLVAFGGYNGKYQNEIFVMKPKPRDSSRPKIFQSPAAAAAAASVTAAYALIKPESVDSTKYGGNNVSSRDVTAELASLKEEIKSLEAMLAEVREENSRQREKIDEASNNHSELSKELQSVQSQLVIERSRCFKLEVSPGLYLCMNFDELVFQKFQSIQGQLIPPFFFKLAKCYNFIDAGTIPQAQIAELQKILESFSAIENEVQELRSQKTALERDIELASATRQSSGGLLGWLAGGPRSP